jgi:hypothetical protein
MNFLLWAKRFTGVCCICLFLIFLGLLIGYTYSVLESPYGGFNLAVVIFLTSLASGTLLFGTAGANLLTGKYQEHQHTLYRIWLVLGFLTFFLFVSALAMVPVR